MAWNNNLKSLFQSIFNQNSNATDGVSNNVAYLADSTDTNLDDLIDSSWTGRYTKG